MKSALFHLESQFEELLDTYCLAFEQGELEQAEQMSVMAEDYLEAIGVLKVSKLLEQSEAELRALELGQMLMSKAG
jgi:hypothetical protein